MKRFRIIGSTAIVSLALAGCVATGPGGGGNVPVVNRAPSGIDGAWVDPNGIVSSFNGGIFETRSTDTNESWQKVTIVTSRLSLLRSTCVRSCVAPLRA